ncbi:enolase C-terminal domain-like protein [Paenarthrobacter nitroguajacolicus]|uniref:enolase C-terminal domain-like protein n=1 Tax=Paenarthrobacter nitroguajacolicus TaxID=211146 RepID=UPI003D7C2B1C
MQTQQERLCTYTPGGWRISLRPYGLASWSRPSGQFFPGAADGDAFGAGYRRVRDALDTPIAGGEAEFTLYGFQDLINAGAIDFAQHDICLAGGFTALKHINVLAQAGGVQVNPHVWGTAIGQYASLHAIANTPTTHHALFAPQPLLNTTPHRTRSGRHWSMPHLNTPMVGSTYPRPRAWGSK